MDSGIPVPISSALLIPVVLIAALRLVFSRSTTADRRINTALIFAAMCCLLRDRTVQAVIAGWSGSRISPALMYQLSELAVIPAAGALFLLGYAWINDVEPRHLARLVYSAVTVCALATLLLGLNARARHVPLQIHSGWAVIAYSSSPPAAVAAIVFHDSLIYWFSIIIALTCIREMRQRTNRRAVAIAAGMATVAIGALVQTTSISVATLLAASGQRNAYITNLGRLDRFTVEIFTGIGAFIAAVPLAGRAAERFHLDKYSLRRRHLLPLWRDLTTACPEIVYLSRGPVAGNRSRYLLHRTVVEIRDCILILSRYASRRDETAVGTIVDPPTLRQAVRLALAWSAKTSGEPASDDFAAQHSAATELLDEIEELSTLAGHWAPAKAVAADIMASRAPT